MHDLQNAKQQTEHLTGKPIPMRWWGPFLLMPPWLFLVGVTFGTIMHISTRTDIPIGTFISLPGILSFVGLFFFALLIGMWLTPRSVVLEKSGLIYQNWLQQETVILYTEIESYTFNRGLRAIRAGIVIRTPHGRGYIFLDGLTGSFYLRDEIRRKVGADKEVQREARRQMRGS